MRLILGLLISICLTACGGSGSKAVNTPAPTISTFASTATTIGLGDSATLTTAFTNGSASIDNGVGSVFSDFVVVTPSATTTYTLTVTNAAGTRVTQSLEVIVKPFLTGYFTDSAVEGLNYATETQSGITNNLGAFTYLEGETISFTIGKFVLGDTVAAKAAMTPLDLTAPSLSLPTTNGEFRLINSREGYSRRLTAEGINFAKFQNLLIFLQALDRDKDASNGITIPEGMSALLEGVELDFEADPFLFKGAFAFRKVMAEAVTGSLIADGFIKTSEYALIHYYEQQGINTFFTQVGRESIDNNGDNLADDITTYTYDANGNLLTTSFDNDANGVTDDTYTYTYDANGNLLTESYEYGTVSLQKGITNRIYTSTYDANGNRLLAIDDNNADGKPDDIVTRTYDDYGDMLTESYEYGTVSLQLGLTNRIYTTTYDANGNRLTESSDNDANGVTDDTTTLTYDANGNQLTQSTQYGVVSLKNGLTNDIYTSTWDANDNLVMKKYENKAGGDAYLIFYDYDANGNRLTVSFDWDANGVTDDTTTYTYDANDNRLTESSEYGSVSLQGGAVNSITKVTYDANGNQLTTSYDNDANRVTDDTATFTYDDYGNMLTTSYEFGTVSLQKGAENNKITKTYDANGNLVTQSSQYGVDITNRTYTNVGSPMDSGRR